MLALALAALSSPLRADLVAPVSGGHGTVVINGQSGAAVVDGGILRGGNLFQRLQQLNTRSVESVLFRTRSNRVHGDAGNPALITSIILSVRERALIDKPLTIESQGAGTGTNFYLLSPLGISISGAGRFEGVNTLLLTTARQFDLGNGSLYSLDTSDAELAGSGYAHNAALTRGLAQILTNQLREAQTAGARFFEDAGGATIEIADGVRLKVSGSLLVVANAAPIQIEAARLIAAGNDAGTVLTAGATFRSSGDIITSVPDPADGVAIVGRDISLIGSTLRTNSQFLIREPLALNNPEPGVLAAPIVPSFRWNAVTGLYDQTDVSRLDTLSNIFLQSVRILRTDADVASRWGGLINVLGFGNRNGRPPAEGSVPLNAPNPSPSLTDGSSFTVNTLDPGSSTYLGGYAPADPATLGSTGRLAYSGLRIDGLTIRPSGDRIASVDLTLATDWGFARRLVVDTQALRNLASREFHLVQGLRASGEPGSVTGGSAITGDPATSLWNFGAINVLADAGNANVRYLARWWDGGDITNNNITIQALGRSFTSKRDDTINNLVIAVNTSFDQAEFDFNQTVFSDADGTSVSGGGASQRTGGLTVSLGPEPSGGVNQLEGQADPAAPSAAERDRNAP